MPVETLQYNIKYLRTYLGLSQERFGNSICAKRGEVANWEVGFCSPQLKHLIYIKSVYNISIDELCRRELKFENKHSQLKTKQQ